LAEWREWVDSGNPTKTLGNYSYECGDSVSVVARCYDVNANQLLKWRRQYREGLLADEPDFHSLILIAVTPSPTSKPVPEGVEKVARDSGRLEITLAGGPAVFDRQAA